MSEKLLSSLQGKFPGVSVRPSLDCPAFNIPADDLIGVATLLRDELQYDLLVDVSGIDWQEGEPRFSVAYHLTSTVHRGYIRLVADCPDNEAPKLPSVAGIWRAADWHEREAFDMFGIGFSGHPDLRRILMWDEYPYFPLRKDFPLAGIETPFPDEEIRETTGAKLISAPMSGGPFVAKPGPHLSEAEPRAKDESWSERKPKPEHR